MLRFIKLFAVVITLCVALSSCFYGNTPGEIFGIDVSSGEIISESDSHGGFHGDGEYYLEIKFSDKSAAEAISASEDWLPLPADRQTASVIWGIEETSGDESVGIGPFVLVEIPEIENGWYSFVTRGPMNYTFAVYDADADMMYYVESDA